jgi:hypothetical protein
MPHAPQAGASRAPHLRDGVIVAKVGIERSSTVFLLALATATATLYRFPPERYPFYPRCPIREFLHLQCPGCGATRALSALLHGHLSAALHCNAFAVLVLLPLAATYALICLYRSRSRSAEPFRWPAIPSPVTIALVVLAASFTLLRNL